MCFSLEMSTVMLVLGSITTFVAARNINSKAAMLVGYFTIMQAIHILGYLTINDCDNTLNQIASYTNYAHVCFQPFFFLIGLYGLMEFCNYNDKKSVIRIQYALKLSFMIGVLLFIRMFNLLDKTQTKANGSCVWCGKVCSFKGEKHINFSLPLTYPHYLTPSLFLHTFGMFIIPLFINKFTAFSTLILFLTTYIPSVFHGVKGSEAGTIWCFTSILQCIVIFMLALFWKK